jgi:NAD(P)-dependent dehydrogenase (short-subunit alcohol dehydrogenase family)
MRTWFITGVNSGFGREMSERLLAAGDRVAGTSRKPNEIAALKEAYGDRFWSAELEMTDVSAIGAVVDRAFAELGRIDVVVANAGYGLFGPVEGLTRDQIRHQIDTNLVGPVHLAKSAIPHLREQGGGRIIAMSSYGGQATHAGASLYHASKWGLEGFFDALAGEIAPFGIGVTIVEPGGFPTGFRKAAAGLVGADVEAYKSTPIGKLREILSDPDRASKSDPGTAARIIIESVDRNPAPKRLVIGADAFSMIENALMERLASVREQKAEAERNT